ncbi:hypothetical protein BDY19DRAFT_999069 [Irpex rosettiformis]|uniref:Uncharacterized protein n=1 Tax=Irpex rosettiformis TaxID=378272 RepID=A0ACB8TLP0_9APHY|nr:hypothetical protein BDY19DRAFT_999069 [Irpex rosettiformis]
MFSCSPTYTDIDYDQPEESGSSESEYQPDEDKDRSGDQPSSGPSHPGNEENSSEEDLEDRDEDSRMGIAGSGRRSQMGVPAAPRWNWWALPPYREVMLESYEEFRDSSGRARKELLASIARRLRHCASEHHTPLPPEGQIGEKIKNWFGNYRGERHTAYVAKRRGVQSVETPPQPKGSRSKHEDGGQVMTMRRAVPILFPDEIESIVDELMAEGTKGKGRMDDMGTANGGDGSNAEDESAPRIAYMQDAISAFLDDMDDEMRETAEDFIEDCNANGRARGLKPKEVTKMARLIHGLEGTLHRVYGAHALILVGFSGESGVGCITYKRQPARVEQYSSQPGFDTLKKNFEVYCQSLVHMNESTFTKASRNKVHRTDPHDGGGLKWYIPTDRQGWAHVITSFPERMLLPDMKDVMRAFWTSRYRVATGNKNARVPFGKIIKHPGRFFDKKFMPSGVFFNDPTRLSKTELLSIVDHWKKRLESNKVAFYFHGVWKDDFQRKTASDIPSLSGGEEKRAEFTSFTMEVEEAAAEEDQIMSIEVPDSDDELGQPTQVPRKRRP